MKLFGIVICFLCASFLEASETYRAGVLHFDKEIAKDYASFVYEAGKSNVDILVLPTDEAAKTIDNYDQTVKSLSKAAKEAKLYVVAHLYEKARCQNTVEVVKSNLVFDREGSIVSVYRKPVSSQANCTSSPTNLVKFTTDFGVTFGLLMNEDIVLRDVGYMKGLKNFVMTGTSSDKTFLSAAQFSSSWSYVNNVNLISSHGIYVGKSGLKISSERLVVADLDKNGGSETSVVPTAIIPSEDLSQYTTRSLDLEASTKGYKESVCHRSFCCEFYVKTQNSGSKSDVSYRLAAFDGAQPFTAQHNIGAQNCVVFGANNNTIKFEKISISANFTKPNAQYPVVQSKSVLPIEKFNFETKTVGASTQVILDIVDGQNVVKMGIFGRDFSKDFESISVRNNSDYDTFDFISEDVQEFFDYVWIRLRILIVVVSIYVLEML